MSGGPKKRSAPTGGHSTSRRSYIRDLWHRREFTVYLALARIQARNSSTSLGLLWWVLNPLMLAGIYYLIFGIIFDARQDLPVYFPYLVSGVFAFYYTRGALLSSTSTILANAKLMVNLKFPRLTLVVAGVLESGFGFVASLFVYLLVALPMGAWPGVEIAALPIVVILHSGFNLGLGALGARFTIPFRDLHNLLPYALRLWLYLSPVVYTMEQVPGGLRMLIAVNPLTPILGLYRWCLLGQPLEPWVPIAAVGWTLLAIGLGVPTFTRAERHFVRYL